MADTATSDRAKRPVSVVAGPYGHPFHPILVTIPIGAWVASLVFDIASRASDDAEAFTRGSYWLIGIGVLGAAAAAIFGFLDLVTIPRGTPAFRTALTHMSLNLAVVVAFVASFVLRSGTVDDGEQVGIGLIALSVVALAALGASGWLGGKLTYRYGVRVADEHTQLEGYTDGR